MEKQIEKLRHVAGTKPILAWRSACRSLQLPPLQRARCASLPLQRWLYRGGSNSPVPPLPGQTLEAEAGSHGHIAPAPAVLLLAGHQHSRAATETASQILLPRGDRQAEAGTCLPG